MSEVEAEDRTQAPSKLRRQQARAAGIVAQSRELTGAAAMLGVALGLRVWGQGLSSALVEIVRAPWSSPLPLSLEMEEVTDRLRSVAWDLAMPLGGTLVSGLVAAIVVHQVQVGGLFVPGLIAPDLSRLSGLGGGGGITTRISRGLWSLGKVAAVLAVSAFVVRSEFYGAGGLARMDTMTLSKALGASLANLAAILALVMIALGLIDFGFQYLRLEAMLRSTPDEAREDEKATDGDPALRARRRRAAKNLRGDSPELLVGATLTLTGPRGLTLVLGGGPPPRRVTVRSSASGAAGLKLRKSAEKAGIPTVSAPEIAIRLARLRVATPPPEAVADLKAIWP